MTMATAGPSRAIFGTLLGRFLGACLVTAILLLIVCALMVEHLHLWLVLPYVLLVAVPLAALAIYRLQGAR
jgi:hypothetical protein